MRYLELLEYQITPVKNWTQAQALVDQHGLTLTNRGGRQKYFLSLPNQYYQFNQKYKIISDGTFGHIFGNIDGFNKAINRLLDIKKTLDDVMNNPSQLKNTREEKFYEWLNGFYVTMKEDTSHVYSKPQLYIPRPQKNKYLNWTWDFDNEGNVRPHKKKEYGIEEDVKGQLIPVSTSAPKGDTKPRAQSFWTSSGTQTADGTWTSDWNRYVQGNVSEWYNPYGYVYKVNPSARILSLDNGHYIQKATEEYAKLRGDFEEYEKDDMNVRKHFPWDLLHKHWDAVHTSHPARSAIYQSLEDPQMFTYGYDAESTVWLNTNVLTLMGKVKIKKYDSYDDEN
jgi:hypothetical protein